MYTILLTSVYYFALLFFCSVCVCVCVCVCVVRAVLQWLPFPRTERNPTYRRLCKALSLYCNLRSKWHVFHRLACNQRYTCWEDVSCISSSREDEQPEIEHRSVWFQALMAVKIYKITKTVLQILVCNDYQHQMDFKMTMKTWWIHNWNNPCNIRFNMTSFNFIKIAGRYKNTNPIILTKVYLNLNWYYGHIEHGITPTPLPWVVFPWTVTHRGPWPSVQSLSQQTQYMQSP